MSVKFTDNSKLILSQMGTQMNRALYAIGVSAVGDVVKYMGKKDFTGKDIVDTGRLRGSISFVTPKDASGTNSSKADVADALRGKAKKNTVLVGSNVEYAGDVNNGTKGSGKGRGRPARSFLQNGINPNKAKYGRLAKKIFKGEL